MEGGSVCYVSDAAVYHSHNYDYSQEFRRSFDIGVLHTSEQWLLETFGNAEGVGRKYVRSALNEIISKKEYSVIVDWFYEHVSSLLVISLDVGISICLKKYVLN